MSLLEYINSRPRGFFLPDMGTNGLDLVDYNTYQVYEDPKKQLELALKMNEVFESDFSYSLCDGAICSEALGIELYKPAYDFPSVIDHPIKTMADIKKIQVPNPYKTGRMPTNLKSLRLIAENIDKPLYVSIQGPFTLAIQIAGATHLLKSTIKDPGYVKELLEFTKRTVKNYAQAVNEAGAQYISISEPGAITLSPSDFEKYVVPVNREIFASLNCWRGMHICGDTSEILELMLTCDLDALSLDQIMNYEKVAPKIPSNIVLIGNLDPIDLVGKGKPEEIRQATLAHKEKMKHYKNHLIALGCNCLNDTPVENLQALIETARS